MIFWEFHMNFVRMHELWAVVHTWKIILFASAQWSCEHEMCISSILEILDCIFSLKNSCNIQFHVDYILSDICVVGVSFNALLLTVLLVQEKVLKTRGCILHVIEISECQTPFTVSFVQKCIWNRKGELDLTFMIVSMI